MLVSRSSARPSDDREEENEHGSDILDVPHDDEGDAEPIDAAIAAGRITYIPRGVSGLNDSGVPYDSIDRAIAAHKAWLARYDRAMMVPQVKAKKPARLQRFEWTPEQDALILSMRLDGACRLLSPWVWRPALQASGGGVASSACIKTNSQPLTLTAVEPC